MKNLFILLVSAALVACRSTSAPAGPEQPQYPQGNMSIENGWIVVQALMNDSIPLKLMFDTGHYGLSITKKMLQVYMPPDFKFFPDNSAGFPAPRITIDTADLRYPFLFCFSHENIVLQNYGMDGIFAPNYRSDHRIWELNFEQGYMKLHDSISVPEGALVLPIRFDKDKVFPVIKFPMQFVNGSDTLRTNYEYIFDTGTNTGFVFTSLLPEIMAYTERIPHIDRRIATQESATGVLRSFDLDQIIIPDFATVYDVRGGINPGTEFMMEQNSVADAVGTIGMHIFKHFNVFIDLKDNRLILVKHDRPYPNNKAVNSIGLVFQNDNSTVRLIDIGSPADKAGILIGDRVISMNGELNSELGKAGIDSIRLLPAGVPIKMQVERGGREFEVTIETYKYPLKCD